MKVDTLPLLSIEELEKVLGSPTLKKLKNKNDPYFMNKLKVFYDKEKGKIRESRKT